VVAAVPDGSASGSIESPAEPSAPAPAESPAVMETQPGEFTRFTLPYRFALDEVTTKLNILREEFNEFHDHNPIEHVLSRLKSPASIIAKARRIGCAMEFDEIERHVLDIAGVRVVCSFVSDVYTMFQLLSSHPDIVVLEVEDYIAHPKPNGYRSLHATLTVPVLQSGGIRDVFVELQFRTVAMDSWASIEHKLLYKYDGHVPDTLADELRLASEEARLLDERMERLRQEVERAANDAPD
jgi:putative GTP pyrophosphokinase